QISSLVGIVDGSTAGELCILKSNPNVHVPMRTQHLPRCGPALTALLSLFLFPLQQTWAQPPVDSHVEIRGELLMAGTERHGSLEVVELDNRVCVPLHIRPNGHFALKLAAGNKAYLRFEQDGYLTKE